MFHDYLKGFALGGVMGIASALAFINVTNPGKGGDQPESGVNLATCVSDSVGTVFCSEGTDSQGHLHAQAESRTVSSTVN